MTSIITLLLVLLSTAVQLGAARLDGRAIAASGRGGRSNFRKLESDDLTVDPTGFGDGDDELELSSTAATLLSATEMNEEAVVTPTTPNNSENDDYYTKATEDSGGEDEEENGTIAAGGKCSFCEGGIPDPDIVPEGTDDHTCAQIQATAADEPGDSPICKTVLIPLESICCPQNLPSDGVPPAVAEEETTLTTPAAVGDENNDFDAGVGNDTNAEVPTTATPDSVGDGAKDFVGDEGSAENTTTAATSSASSQESTTSATTDSAPLSACVESAKYQGVEDPLYTCCQTHPTEAICVLNGCMDFESQVITCQCQEVLGIGQTIFNGNDPNAVYLPDMFEDFLGTFPQCCPDSSVPPSEFNDCYYDEISEEIMEEMEEEIEEEFGLEPTYKPTPRPSSLYIPRTDDEDPVSNQGPEDFSNGQKDDSLQGMINTYLDGVESPDEMKSDKNVQVVAVSFVYYACHAELSVVRDRTKLAVAEHMPLCGLPSPLTLSWREECER